MMVDVNYQMLLSTLQTVGLLIGIFYYIMTLRNAQKNRMKEMVLHRIQDRTPEYLRMARSMEPMFSGWNTVEEFFEKFNYHREPELTIARNVVFNSIDTWGFLFKEGLVGEEFIDRLHAPWYIIRMWETFEPIFIDGRERSGNPEHRRDFEYLYRAVKKKYPNISADTKLFARAYE